jgi:hypothetical protein
MKIGILTIATGKYSIYLPELIESCENLFLSDHEKSYFVYTDSEMTDLPEFKGSEKVTRIHQEKLGWPYDSMMRFHMFDAFRDMLSKVDYLFFMNANMKLVSPVDTSILPAENRCGIVVTQHPGYYKSIGASNLPYEGNVKSEFYVPQNQRNAYFQGCFNGGRSSEFLSMCATLKDKIDKDLLENIIPVWHDETALNWYVINQDPLILPPTYAYPEHCDGEDIKRSLVEKNEKSDLPLLDPDFATASVLEDPFRHIIDEFGDLKIIQRNKNMDGGKIYLRK